MHRLRGNQLATLTIVLVVSVLLLVAAGGGGATRLHLRAPASSWEGLVGGPRPQVALGQRMIVVLRGPSLSTHLARSPGATRAEQAAWTRTALAGQGALIRRLAASGVIVRPEFRYARVLDGFSAPLNGPALALLENDRQVAGVYPVRAAFPAAEPAVSDQATGMGDWTGALLPGFDGRGVTIALLDTGVDLSHPWLRGRVLDGVDLVGRSKAADAHARPGDPSEVEEHGTEIASLLVGSGPGLAPVAPGATLYPIRVAGWQRDANQAWSIFGRTDQILAGLERAVDPNRDGDVSDAARVALVPLAEPFAAFPDEPLARAAAGAARLGTLVVAPAGNDGPAAAVFGSVSGPGAAPAALTVGAADLRPRAREARVVLRSGLEVLIDRALPLAGAAGPDHRIQLRLTLMHAASGTPPSLDQFFDARGFSRVAGQAVLIAGTSAVELVVERAARAGAAAVLLYGAGPPPGALGGAGLSVPVVTLPRAIGPSLAEAVRRGANVEVTIGPTGVADNASTGRVAPFSSHGLAFDGRPKPDLVAPGVGLAAAEPGFSDKGLPQSGTVNGSSVAAAVAAGAAAVLAEARPALGAKTLKALLIGSAQPIGGDPMAAQGAGLVDVGSAASRELVSEPSTLALGPVTGTGTVSTTFRLRNVSTRRLILGLVAGPASPRRTAAVSVSPTRVDLPAGAARTVRLRVAVKLLPARLGAMQGTIVAAPLAGGAIRIPWTIGTRPARLTLLTGVSLSASSFAPSDTAPAVLAFQAGRLLSGEGGPSVQPVSRLDIELWDETEARPSKLGLLARLRDLLPGRYAFGLTGRDPHGKVLPAGQYRVQLIAYPTVRGAATRRSLLFTVERPKP